MAGRRLFFGTVLLAVLPFSLYAKKPKDTVVYRYPMDIPVEISGCFGELRSTHFHGGTDFRTQQREGIKVFSIAPGVIEKAEVSRTGYGKALYIRHADNTVSVYAHLSKFIPAIEKQIKKRQKDEGTDEVKVPLARKTGAHKLVAYSGNSGSSGGPHLHLEIRRNDSIRLNPSCWGLPVYDTVAPVFYYWAVYENGGTDAMETWTDSCMESVCTDAPSYDYAMRNVLQRDWKDRYGPLSKAAYYSVEGGPDTVRVNGSCGFGLCALDYIQDMPFRYGLYGLAFCVQDITDGDADGAVDTLAFYRLRELVPSVYGGIQKHLDNNFYELYKKRMEKSWVDNATQPTPYTVLRNLGRLDPVPGHTYRLLITGTDFSGNRTSFSCILLA